MELMLDYLLMFAGDDRMLALGGQQDGNLIKFASDAPLMDIYPRILVDDGMGYPVPSPTSATARIARPYRIVAIMPVGENHIPMIPVRDLHKRVFTIGRRMYIPSVKYRTHSFQSI